MSQSYYLWTSYKGITNMMNVATGTYSVNNVKTWNDLLFRGEGDGNQNYYMGRIGNIDYIGTHGGIQIFSEDYNAESLGNPEGIFYLNFASFRNTANNFDDTNTQNLGHGDADRKGRSSMDSFHDKTGLTDEEIANFYGNFAVSRGFNRAYRIKTSTAVNNVEQGVEGAKQARVSINNDGNYVDVADGEFKIRFSNNTENPFEGIGILFGFATWPLKEDILLPKTPNKFNTTYALKCFFDEDVTDLQTSHITATNCSIISIYKKSAKEQWVIFTIDSPTGSNFYTEYSIIVNKDNVTAVNDTNKKNRSQSISYNCLSNDGSVIWAHTTTHLAYSTDLGDTWTNTTLNRNAGNIRYFGNFFFSIDFSSPDTYISYDGINWETEITGAVGYTGIRSLEKNTCLAAIVYDIAKGKDGSGNDLILAVGTNINNSTWRSFNSNSDPAPYSIAYSRDGGINWYANGKPSSYRIRQHGHAGLGNFPYKNGPYVNDDYKNISIGYSIAYGNGIWVFGGQNNNNNADNLLYSNDGYSFFPASYNGGTNYAGIRALTFCKDTFVFGTGSGEIGYSTDGENWTIISTKPFDKVSNLTSDNSGVIVATGWGDSGNKFISYSTDFGKTWNDPSTTFNFNQTNSNYPPVIWNGSKFFVVGQSTDGVNRLMYSSDGDSWTVKSLQNFGGIMSNYFPEESNESKVSGIAKTTVASVLNVDVSLNYYPTELIPTEWWDNLSTQESDTSGREKEYDTRRNFLFENIFEGNPTLTNFDISTNNLQMTKNTVKDTIRVYKLNNNQSVDINLNTNTDINEDKGFYVQLKNTNDKIAFTNAANDISFNLVRTGTDSDGNATYDIVKTGGDVNLVVDF